MKPLDKLHLTGFDVSQQEIDQVEKIALGYLKKLEEAVSFDSIEMTLKKSAKGKVFNHEIKCHIQIKGKVLSADIVDYNLFKAVSVVLEKLLHEAQHLKRTSRQVE